MCLIDVLLHLELVAKPPARVHDLPGTGNGVASYTSDNSAIHDLPGTERAIVTSFIPVFALVKARLMLVGRFVVQHLAALLTLHTRNHLTIGSDLPSREGPKRMGF